MFPPTSSHNHKIFTNILNKYLDYFLIITDILIERFKSKIYSIQGQTYTRAEGGHAPPIKKKKKNWYTKKLRFALIYIYICLSSSKLNI